MESCAVPQKHNSVEIVLQTLYLVYPLIGNTLDYDRTNTNISFSKNLHSMGWVETFYVMAANR